jgi:predicted Zn finger-like uncharacterized protein
MEVRCDKCQARYRVDDARIGPQGLTMRCGKCQNTFKVTRPAAGAEAARPAPKPAPAAAPPPAAGPEIATQMFVAPKPAAAPAKPPIAARPVPAKPAPAKPAAAPADESAGRTMMFQTGNVKTAPVAKPAKMEPEAGMATMVQATPPKHYESKPAADAEPGSTMVFAPPTAQPKPGVPVAKTPAKASSPAAPADESSGATMMFGTAPLAKDANTPATAVRPPTASDPGPPVEAAESAPEPHDEPAAEGPTALGSDDHEESPAADHPDSTQETSSVEAEGAEDAAAAPGRFDKAPPKGLLIGVAAGLAVLVVALIVAVAIKKMGSRPPPQAALDSMAAAQADADQDSLASIGSAESKAKEALDEAGPKAKFSQGVATFAMIEVQYADALADEAQQLTDKSAKETDDKKKADDDARVTDLGKQAEAKLKAAIDSAGPAYKSSPNSAELLLALADYYRAKRTPSLMNKFIKAAQANNADEARISFIMGARAAQEDDGAERAVAKLKEAAAANPQSARMHFRLALAYLAMKDEASASTELKTTLKLSPQHERAKVTLEGLPSAERK